MSGDGAQDLIALGDVAVDVCVTLGETQVRISEILRYAPGTVIPLNCKADTPVRLTVNGTAVASGHIVESDEGALAIEICDVICRPVPATP